MSNATLLMRLQPNEASALSDDGRFQLKYDEETGVAELWEMQAPDKSDSGPQPLTVRVEISGGVAEVVGDIPKGVRLVIHDYDEEEVSEDGTYEPSVYEGVAP